MKKMKVLLIGLLVIIFMAGCSSGNDSASEAEGKMSPEEEANQTQEEVTVYKVGVVSSRAEEIWENVNERLEPAENIRVETVLFSDYVNPNIALADGSIDANAYQYIPFLNDFNMENGTDLLPIGYLSVEPMGIWASEGIESFDDLPEGAQIAVIDDPVNIGNSLVHMQKAGLITLAEDVGPTPSEADVIENPKNIEIVPMETGMVARSIEDLELVMPGATAAKESGLNIDDAFYFEDTDETSYLFRLTFTTREELTEDEGLRTAMEYYQTQETVDYANETAQSTFYPGWENDDNASEDYREYANMVEKE